MLDDTIFNRVANSPIVDQEIPKTRSVEPNIDNFHAYSGGRGAAETRGVDSFTRAGYQKNVRHQTGGVDDFTQAEKNSVLISPEEANTVIRQTTNRVAGPPPKSTAQQFADEGITAADILKVENTNIFTRGQSFAGEGESFSVSVPKSTGNHLDQIQSDAIASSPGPESATAIIATNLTQVKEAIAEKDQLKPDEDTKKAENSVDSHPSPSRVALESELEDLNHKIDVNNNRLASSSARLAELEARGDTSSASYKRHYNLVNGPSGYKMKAMLMDDRAFGIEQKIAKL